MLEGMLTADDYHGDRRGIVRQDDSEVRTKG